MSNRPLSRVMLFAGVFLALQIAVAARAENKVEPPPSLLPPQPIVLPYQLSQDINHEDYYFSNLLRLALDKSVDTYGPWQPRMHTDWLRDKRLRLSLAKGTLDVIWSPTSKSFESEMRAVKIPLLKGLSQYRLLLIHEEDQPRFNAVKSLNDLAVLRGGMGIQWPDAAIMKGNGLKLITVTGYGKLFKMLAARRFDYFSRGIYQIQSEVAFYPALPLAIEKTLLLKYEGAIYFFVARENKQLAERIEYGLKKAKADGSFDRLFLSVPRYQWAMDELQKGHRTTIELRSIEH